jgi:hypothetical protein
MYINLCVETNRYIDTNKDSNSRKDLDFYDGMATSPEMDEANVSDISEIVARSRNHREPRPRDMSVLSRFKTRPPPPKESRRRARGRVEDEGE